MAESEQMLRSRQIEALYWASQDQPASERETWLRDACGADANLHDNVIALASKLSAGAKAPAIFAADPPSAIAAAVVAGAGGRRGEGAGFNLKAGDRLGPYELLREIGRGGMGVVFEAREDPPLGRIVAIKVVRAGMDTEEIVTRFELERRILADLNHPNICRVFSAGATPNGRPYFAMELVHGPRITDYCDEKKLNVQDRLRLMVPVCKAVAYANGNGIIHRDIKPQNVLVAEDKDGNPVPKIIDFGIAKATELAPEARAILTATNAVLGTQLYWSPEQAGVITSPVDNRTDVYLLGNLLFELLTGTPRIDPGTLQQNALAQVLALLGDEPPRPRDRLTTLDLARLKTVAQDRSSDPRSLTRLLRQEPEWIVLQALRIAPDTRYQTASDLASDLENYLAGKPIKAGPALWYQQAWTAIRKHKAIVGFAATVAVAVLIAITGLTLGLLRARSAERMTEVQRVIAVKERTQAQDQRHAAEQARDEASRQRQDAQAVLGFLIHDVLAWASPERTPDKIFRDQLVKRLIQPAVATVENSLTGRPEVRSAVQLTLAGILRVLGDADQALPLAQAAWKDRQTSQGNDSVDAFIAEQEVGSDLMLMSRLSEAQDHFEKLVVRAQATDGDRFDVDGSLIDLLIKDAATELAMGHLDQGLAASKSAWERGRRLRGDDDRLTLDALNMYAGVLQNVGKQAEALRLGRDGLDLARRKLGPQHLTTIRFECSLSQILIQLGHVDEALSMARDGMDQYRHLLGEDHPASIDQEITLAGMLLDAGRPADAIPQAQDALVRARRISGEDHFSTIRAEFVFAKSLEDLQRWSQAEPALRDLWPRVARVFGAQSPMAIVTASEHARVLISLDRGDEAEAPAAAAYRAMLQADQLNEPVKMGVIETYCDMLRMTGRASDAEPIARAALEKARILWGEKSPMTSPIREGYAKVLVKMGRIADAKALLQGFSPINPSQPAVILTATSQPASTSPSKAP